MSVKLNELMSGGIRNIADTAARFYLNDRKGQRFILGMTSALRKSAKLRDKHEREGVHVPPFLIASIASSCNLRCSGCYAMASGIAGDASGCAAPQMDSAEWRRIFTEAGEVGVSFILIAGGEPFLRRDILTLAAENKEIIFPVFTNGTMMDDDYFVLFDEHRNLIPVLSIEGDAEQTDMRRGAGVSEKIRQTALRLQKNNILYGASITVTSENMDTVTASAFVDGLWTEGCGLIFFVEYVPVEKNTEHLILSEEKLETLQARVNALRREKKNKGMIILSFPGDEEAMGGCLAAGRGFFHINPAGGAEPCPFSPYSEDNLREKSLLSVLNSPFFGRVREIGAAEALSHKGGCTLFNHEERVELLLGK